MQVQYKRIKAVQGKTRVSAGDEGSQCKGQSDVDVSILYDYLQRDQRMNKPCYD